MWNKISTEAAQTANSITWLLKCYSGGHHDQQLFIDGMLIFCKIFQPF